MEISLEIEDENCNKNYKQIDKHKFHKMCFLWNALEDGWTIKKKGESYIFTKKHQDKKEIFLDSFITSFVKDNIDINKILL